MDINQKGQMPIVQIVAVHWQQRQNAFPANVLLKNGNQWWKHRKKKTNLKTI